MRAKNALSGKAGTTHNTAGPRQSYQWRLSAFIERLSDGHADGPRASLWRQDDAAAAVAKRIWAQLSLGKARDVHRELGKLIRQCQDDRRDGMERGLR
jgi:hypothetical protein